MKHTKKLAALGLTALLGGVTAFNAYHNHNPSFYAIDGNAEEGLVPGEKKFKVYMNQSTVDEIRNQFNTFFVEKYGIKPQEDNVKEDDLVQFGVEYVGDKLKFRHPVMFPQKAVNGIRKLPFGMALMPKKETQYFELTTVIDVAGKKEILTDCWDYSQLFKNVFNILSGDYNLGSISYRVIGDTYIDIFGLEKKVGDHDFNMIKDKAGNKRFVDSNGPDTVFITNPADITHKVRVRPNKVPGKKKR